MPRPGGGQGASATGDEELDPTTKQCSFCGEAGQQDPPLLSGLGAFICAPCIDDAADRLAAHRRGDTEGGPRPWLALSTTDLLSRLWLIARTRHHAEEFLVEWVHHLRHRRVSWTEIGKALGISRQEAQQRFAVPR